MLVSNMGTLLLYGQLAGCLLNVSKYKDTAVMNSRLHSFNIVDHGS